MYMFRLESFLGKRDDLSLCEYLGTPLCGKVCGLGIHVSMVLDFKYVVWGVYCVTRHHIGVRFVYRFLFGVEPLLKQTCEVINS